MKRARLSGAESKAAALEAARAILAEDGPDAITLKAVGVRIGRTHGNLLHHFGSAAGLERALLAHVAAEITGTIGAAVLRARRGEIAPRTIVDMTFDAFDAGGAAALVYKLGVGGGAEALEPILTAIHALVDELASGVPGKPVAEMTLALTLAALGDALLGAALTAALGLPRDAARRLSLEQLVANADWGPPATA